MDSLQQEEQRNAVRYQGDTWEQAEKWLREQGASEREIELCKKIWNRAISASSEWVAGFEGVDFDLESSLKALSNERQGG